MKIDLKSQPREFEFKDIKIKDYGKIMLDDNEMVSFVTKSGRECDFTAKDWGFYIGPSLNSRLKKEGFKAALVINEQGQIYVHAVEEDKMDAFNKYLKANQDNKVLCWLDEWLSEKG